MNRFPKKPIAAAVALTFTAAVLADGHDGALDYDYDGPVKIVEALSSAPSTGPVFTPLHVSVENTIVGGDHEVIPPEDQRAGELLVNYVRTYPLDQPPQLSTGVLRPLGSTESTLSSQMTDPSSGSVILRSWHARST